jgi:transcriptional regulator with XRE-family HTH domain
MTTTPEQRAATFSELVAEEIDSVRGRRRMSQAQLAREIGKSEMWVSLRLRGRQEIGLNELALIAKALGVSVFQLMPPTDSVSRDLNRSLKSSHKDDPKPVRHVATRPFGPPRRDPNGPPSATPLSSRRPRDTRPVKRPMAVAS